jgi:nicotinate dehydrogenase subunit B
MSTLPGSIDANPMLDRWIGFDTPARVTIRSGKVELGQGTVTAIAAIAAGELGVTLDQIEIVAGDTRTAPDEGYTAGSLSLEQGGLAMRWAAASARMLFTDAAAKALGGDARDIIVEDGVFSLQGRNVGVDYWSLAPRVDLARSMKELPAPRMSGAVFASGAVPRLDLPAKLTGAGFIHDIVLPDMHFGRVLRPPHPAARLQSFDPAPVEAMPGVRCVVMNGSFVGVVATRDELALKAVTKAATLATWRNLSELPQDSVGNEWLEDMQGADVTLVDEPAITPAAQLVSASYSRPYLAHASIGPACAIAQWNGRALSVWSHTQGVYQLRGAMARALGVDVSDIDIAHAQGAGCYGHNGADDVALDAALLARAAGVPVMCQWTRSEELSSGPFGAAMRVDVEAGLDASGRISHWRETIVSPPHVARPTTTTTGVSLLAAQHLANAFEPAPPGYLPQPSGTGDRNAVPIYDVGARHIVHRRLPQGPLRSSALRALGAHCNVFAIESMMDELAYQAGSDPLAFRLSHLKDPRSRAVLEEVARISGWREDEAGDEGRGRGIGFARYKSAGAWCAVVAVLDLTEKVRVEKVYAAVDCGRAIYRDGVINQIEGGIVQAASWTLKEAVHWSQEGVTTRSWADYPIVSFSETPEIVVSLIDRPDDPPLGAGECAAGPTAGAIANAICHALGVRVRHMPLTPERIEHAINDGEIS